MAGPKAHANAAAPALPEAALLRSGDRSITTLCKRADFLRAARAKRIPAGGFLLQARQRRGDDPQIGQGIRVGFTCSKKIGNAVARNRAKRRLRAVAAEVLPDFGKPGFDYVLIGRPGVTVTRPYAQLLDDMRGALSKLHLGEP